MILDVQTLSITSGLVVLTTGTIFVLHTLINRDSTANRLWALAYLAGILTALSYALWTTMPDAWWTVAVGNGAFVISAGSIWSGCRSFNGRRSRIWVVVAAGLLVSATAAADGPDGGDWAGAPAWLLGVGTFSLLGAAETFTGSLSSNPNARGLSLVLIIESVLFLARFTVLAAWGSQHVAFDTYLGTATTSMVTIVLMIVAVVTMSVLRTDAAPPGRAGAGARLFSRRGLIGHDVFDQLLTDRLVRSAERAEHVTLLHVRVDDADEIAIAFGRAAADHVRDEFVATLRGAVPASAILSDAGPARVEIAISDLPPGEDVALATSLRRAVLTIDAADVPGVKITVSIGTATTHRSGHDIVALTAAAREACDLAADQGGNRVVSSAITGDVPDAGALTV